VTLVPSQTCVGPHKVQMSGIFKASQEARETQPLTASSERKGNLARTVVWEQVCHLISITSLKGYWQQKVASLRLSTASPCACREVSLPLAFRCKTRQCFPSWMQKLGLKHTSKCSLRQQIPRHQTMWVSLAHNQC